MFGKACICLIILQILHFSYVKPMIGDSDNIRAIEANDPPVVCFMKYDPVRPSDCCIVCSGVFITSTHVLTAAHCLENLEATVIKVLIGPGEVTHGRIYFFIWWITFDQWNARNNLSNATVENDIAVLKVYGLPRRLRPPNLSDIRPISALYGLNVTAYGCGLINCGLFPSNIQKANLKIINTRECECIISGLTRTFLTIPNNMFCSNSSPYVQINVGDSGGPVLHLNTLVAINIGVSPLMDAMPFHPDKVNVHIFIDIYKNFIDNVIQGNGLLNNTRANK